MTEVNPNESIRQCQTLDAALQAASEEAAASFGYALPAILYQQGTRRFATTTFPIRLLVDRVKLDTLRKGDDPDEHINRPLIPEHVRAISEYLQKQPEYILPAVTLSLREPLNCYVHTTQSTVRLAWIVLPATAEFAVTDGQHRIKALEEAIRQRPSLTRDGVPVTISYEDDIDRIHQDFVDCAQVKPIPPALLTAFNRRDPLAKLTRNLCARVPVFAGRIEKAAKSVGKNSINLYTMNQVRAFVAELLIGDSMQAGSQLRRAVEERLPTEALFESHERDILAFCKEFTAANQTWARIADSNDDPARDVINSALLRQEYIHMTATGLLVIGRVGHSILRLDGEDRSRMTRALANLDWSRNARMWQGNVVIEDGKVITSRIPVEKAIAAVKETLGLALSPRDRMRLGEGVETISAADSGRHDGDA